MIRFFLFSILFYVLFLIVSNIVRVFLAWRRRQQQSQPPHVDPSTPPPPRVEYKNVADAKFEDIPQPKHTESRTENNS